MAYLQLEDATGVVQLETAAGPGNLLLEGLEVSGAPRASTAQLFAPAIAPGAATIVGATRASAAQLFAPSLTTGPVGLLGVSIPSTATIFPPALTSIAIGSIGAASRPTTLQLHPPSVTGGLAVIHAPTIPVLSHAFGPVRITVGGVTVHAATRGSTAQVFAPVLVTRLAPPLRTVTTGTILSGAQLFPPAVNAQKQGAKACGAGLGDGGSSGGAVLILVGTIMVGGYGDSEACAYLSPDGTITYPQPASAPNPGAGLSAFARLSTGDIAQVGGNAPLFPATGAGVYNASDLTVRSQYTGARQDGFAITADALGHWYLTRIGQTPNQGTIRFTRLDAASAEIATWDIAVPPGYENYPIAHGLAVSDDGLTLYCWLNRGFGGSTNYVHKFSLAGAGAWVAELTAAPQAHHPDYSSLLVVPGSGDLLVAFSDGTLKRYTPSFALVWTAGLPAGAGSLSWQGLAPGVLGDPHFLAWAYDSSLGTYSGCRYCWFDYATGTPDNSRNFTPEVGEFEFDSQFVILAHAVPTGETTPPPIDGGSACATALPVDPGPLSPLAAWLARRGRA